MLNVGVIQTDQLRAAEPACEAQEQERPITYVFHAVAHGVEGQKKVFF